MTELEEMNLTQNEIKIAQMAVLNSRIESEKKELEKYLQIEILKCALYVERKLQEQGMRLSFSEFANIMGDAEFDFVQIPNKHIFAVIDDIFKVLYSSSNTLAIESVRSNYIQELKRIERSL